MGKSIEPVPGRDVPIRKGINSWTGKPDPTSAGAEIVARVREEQRQAGTQPKGRHFFGALRRLIKTYTAG